MTWTPVTGSCYLADVWQYNPFICPHDEYYEIRDADPTGPVGLGKWLMDTSGAVKSPPTLSPDGATLFVGSDDGKVYALKASDGSVVWQYQTRGPVESSPTLSADGATLFVGSDDYNVYALKATDGSVVWKHNTNKKNGSSSPALSNERNLVFVGGKGEGGERVYALTANKGDEQWSSYLALANEKVVALSASGNWVYVNTSSEVIKMSQSSGSRPADGWGKSIDNLSKASPALSADGATLFVGTNDGYIYALKYTDGSVAWRFKTGDAVESPPTLSSDGATLFVGSNDKNVYALNASTGSQVWKSPTGDMGGGSPALSPDSATLFVGSNDKNVYALNTATGLQVWKYTTGDMGGGSPTLSADGATLFVGSNNKNVYAVTNV